MKKDPNEEEHEGRLCKKKKGKRNPDKNPDIDSTGRESRGSITANLKLHFNAMPSMETVAYLANAQPLTREAAASGVCVCADLSKGGLVRTFTPTAGGLETSRASI